MPLSYPKLQQHLPLTDPEPLAQPLLLRQLQPTRVLFEPQPLQQLSPQHVD